MTRKRSTKIRMYQNQELRSPVGECNQGRTIDSDTPKSKSKSKSKQRQSMVINNNKSQNHIRHLQENKEEVNKYSHLRSRHHHHHNTATIPAASRRIFVTASFICSLISVSYLTHYSYIHSHNNDLHNSVVISPHHDLLDDNLLFKDITTTSGASVNASERNSNNNGNSNVGEEATNYGVGRNLRSDSAILLEKREVQNGISNNVFSPSQSRSPDMDYIMKQYENSQDKEEHQQQHQEQQSTIGGIQNSNQIQQQPQQQKHTRIQTLRTTNTTAACEELNTPAEKEGWVTSIPSALQYTLITVLIIFSAFFSGLTLSMMGLDTTGLEIVMSGDDPTLSHAAAKIYPVRKNGNLLLCTLLLGNVAVNTLLGILMAEITGGTVGFLTSTGLIVIFGEILPQALFSRYALQVGERAVPLVKFIIVILYVIAKPLAFCLDKLLGHELGTTYSKAEMSKLLEIHVKEGRFNSEVGTAMKGALQYQEISVKDVMTPIENTFMINIEDRLTFETMATIFKTGYSRIPVYENSVGNIIGVLFVKDLIFIDPEESTPVRNLMQIFGRRTHFVWPDDKLGDVLRFLKKGHTHMAFVRNTCDEDQTIDPYYTLEGIITLEDIIEVILGEEILDETDAWIDADHTKKVNRDKVFDWSRLRLLDAKIVDETLSDDEVRAVAAHLRQNYSSTVRDISDKQLNRMIGATAVTELDEVVKEAGEDLPAPSKLIYVKNEESSICTLILQGKVTVLAGNDNFRSDTSSWSVIATGALTEENYTPDFSAYVSSGPCRCLQFEREIFTAACHASKLEELPPKGSDTVTTNSTSRDDATTDTPLQMNDTTDSDSTSAVRFSKEIQARNNAFDQVPQSDQRSIAESSNHSKAEDIVERSEQRGRLLATLLSDNDSKRNLKTSLPPTNEE